MRPGWVLAHGLGGRTDLPLPTWMFSYGAAFTLVISFVALAVFWPTSRLEGDIPDRTVSDARRGVLRGLAVVGRLVGLAAYAVVLVAAAVGANSPSTNLAPVAVYVVFWVGLLFLSGLVGDLWRVVSPFDTLAALVGRVRPVKAEDPAGAGYWPGAVGLLAFVWVELVYPDRAQPRVLFVLLAGYALVIVGCSARWGRSWLRRGEAFAALFGVVAHVAPLYRADDGQLRLRPPFAGLARLEWQPGLEAVVFIALGSTSFDGLTRTQSWVDLTGDMSSNTVMLVGTAGLLWAIAAVAAAYKLAMRAASGLVAGRMDSEEMSAAFVHSLVPIALAYFVAHYFSLLVLEGQASIALISDPLGRGWDLFGTAERAVDFNLVSPRTVAYVQCAAIVAGHVAGVVVAHDRALALFEKRLATRSQYPLLAAMVVFTVGGLFLLLGG